VSDGKFNDMRRILSIFAGLVCMLSCQPPSELPYTRMANYYVRNDAELPVEGKIDDRSRFDSLFGMATLMGADGQPTPVDWDGEFVLAVVDPATNNQTALDPESLRQEGGELVFTYTETTGGKQSYWTLPVLMIKVDRKYDTGSARFIRHKTGVSRQAVPENQ
jgi:hypothetical protein